MEIYKTLDESNSKFEFLTILTQGKRERHKFNNIQTRQWAGRHKANLVWWPRMLREKSWKGKPKSPANEARAKQESCFWELFIPDALAYLTFNLNMMKGLANGVPVKYHSISFTKKQDQQKFEHILKRSTPGEMVTIESPPDIINVEMFPDFPGDDTKTKAKNESKRKE